MTNSRSGREAAATLPVAFPLAGFCFLAPLLAVLLLSGCESATAPAAVAAAPGAPLYAVVANDVHLPFSFVVSGCEEDVTVAGDLHLLTIETISARADTVTALHANARGTGVGSQSGASYRWTDVFETTMHRSGPGRAVGGSNEALELIGQGKVPNMRVHTTFHFTVNANGTLTVLVDDARQSCG